MNKHQKLVQQKFLNNEQEVIVRLNKVYTKSLADIDAKIDKLMQRFDPDTGDLPQSVIYQIKYQKMLRGQIETILDELQVKQYGTVSEYLDECYTDSFIGSLFDLHGQDVPLMIPLDQRKMVRAVQLESKISKGLYTHLGEDVDKLKTKIAAQVSRSISTGMSYHQTAQALAGYTKIGYNNAIRIARTEGHRVQTTAAMDVMQDAKESGADVVKQWDATLDGATRESHAAVDGELREVEKPFSNGLIFPGDPSGAAGEVINCRCALLQRARWALDDEELETLKERAKFFGLDKSQSFEEFKQNYLAAPIPAAQPQKKTYLTKKKLEQLIADGKTQLDDMQQKVVTDTGLSTYQEVIDMYGDLDNVATFSSNPQMIKSIKQQMEQLQKEMDDWQESLNKKIVAAESKKIKKVQIALQDQLNAYDVKTYSNIWKDDVTTLDWQAKQGSIAAKKQYFEQKLLYAADQTEIDKWQGMLDALDEFDKQGKAYFDIKKQLDKAQNDLTSLLNNGKIVSGKVDDTFSQARKDAALWFDDAVTGFKEADKYFDPPSKIIHSAASKGEHQGFYTYTQGSGGHNRPLAGFQKPWSKPGTGWEEQFFVGAKNVWLDFEGKGDQIRGLTTLIQKSVYDQDVWLQSGQGFATLEGFLKIPYGSLQKMKDADLQQFVGVRDKMYSFISTAVNEGGGSIFNGKPMKINFYAPKGTQMLYASDVGAFGKGENEMILQRGGTYEITRIYWGVDATDGNRKKLFVDMDIHPEAGYDLFQQDPNEWTGSKKNYRNS